MTTAAIYARKSDDNADGVERQIEIAPGWAPAAAPIEPTVIRDACADELPCREPSGRREVSWPSRERSSL